MKLYYITIISLFFTKKRMQYAILQSNGLTRGALLQENSQLSILHYPLEGRR